MIAVRAVAVGAVLGGALIFVALTLQAPAATARTAIIARRFRRVAWARC